MFSDVRTRYVWLAVGILFALALAIIFSRVAVADTPQVDQSNAEVATETSASVFLTPEETEQTVEAVLLALGDPVQENPEGGYHIPYSTEVVSETGQVAVSVYPMLDVNEVKASLVHLGDNVIITEEEPQLLLHGPRAVASEASSNIFLTPEETEQTLDAVVLALAPILQRDEYAQDRSVVFYMTDVVPETGQLVVAISPLLDVNEVRDALADLGDRVVITVEKNPVVR